MTNGSSVHLAVGAGTDVRAEASVTVGSKSLPLFTEASVTVRNTATSWLPPLVPVAMRAGRPVTASEPPARSMMAGAANAQRLLSSWYRDLAVVPLPEGGADREPLPGRGVGSFFSGGADSFYTALTQAHRITHLIFVHGFDIPLKDTVLAETSLDNVRAAAAALGKPLIEVRTNVRMLGESRLLNWGRYFHGVALAHVAQALADHLHTVLVPAQATAPPWGSAPELDASWSSNEVAIEHDGAAITRFGKFRVIAHNDVAMAHLRVCWLNRNAAMNCGRCEKCVRSALMVTLAGGYCPTLPQELSLSLVRRAFAAGGSKHSDMTLDALREVGSADKELAKAVEFGRRVSALRERVFDTPLEGLSSFVLSLPHRRGR